VATKTELSVCTRELDEISDFIERNMERLRSAPQFASHLAQLLTDPKSYIFFRDKDGMHMEPGMPLLNAIAAMRRGGCR